MATSVVYAGIFGAVLASLPALKTQMVVFDTAVVDLTESCPTRSSCSSAPSSAAARTSTGPWPTARGSVRQPHDTILVLISDLYEGGDGTRC